MAYKVFVGNLSIRTNGADLQEAFSHIGPIVNAYVVYQYGRSRRFGFVVFGNARSQQAAIEDMDGQLLDGWQIAVQMPRMQDWDSGPTWNTLEFDGASRGNPGRGGAGAVLFDPDHDVIDTRREYLGTDVTNNEAEYQALIMGLNMALEHDVDRLEICGDSELVIRQGTTLEPLSRRN